MVAPVLIVAACFIFLLACAAAQGADIDSAESELKEGKYSTAITVFLKLLEADPADGRAQRGLLQAYLETGRYSEAETEAKKFLGRQDKENEAQIRLMLGEVYSITGRYPQAISEFERARQTEQAPLRLRADLRRAQILHLTGKEVPAGEIFKTFVTYYEDGEPESAEELTLIATALTYLERYQEANDVFLEAIETDEKYIEAHLGGGELYTSKYNYAEAADFFKDALAINPNSARAHLGVALNKRIEGGDQMHAALNAALKINPNFVEARTLAATLDLEAEKFSAAADDLDEALKINPNSLEAHSLRAAMYWLQSRQAEFDQEVRATLAINPQYGTLYETLAHFATQTRRYRESVDFLLQAVKLSPRQWSSHMALGIGLLRLGKMEEGRTSLELSFEGDPFNVWAKNTLDLLDSMKEYRETKSGDFIIRAAANEHDVLINYATDLLAEAQTRLTAKYKFTPAAPVSVEIFPNHEDFAVRALGLPGLGALGVCFGQVIAQDSPSARPGGDFNWGSTLWHEYTHVITLQITDHLVPRWFSEGLSVFEEHNARPGWGDDWTPETIKAFIDGRWFTIANLDNGFIRPKRPDDVSLAYFQASQICHFINDRHGFDSILAMLKGFREKKKTSQVIQEVLKLSETDFDREFNKYIREKIGKNIQTLEASLKNEKSGQLSKDDVLRLAAEQPDNFILNLRAGLTLYSENNYEKAVPFLKRSIELFPFQSGDSNAYEPLAEIYEKQGNRSAAAEALEGLIRIDENNYGAVKKLARYKIESGDKARALELLRLSFYIDPAEHAAHTQAGDLYLELNQADRAVREFQIALATGPPNIAEAHYNIARAYLAAGKNREARRSVLKSLETAPGFEKAQELLLKLTSN